MCMKKNNNRLLRGVAAVLCLALMFFTINRSDSNFILWIRYCNYNSRWNYDVIVCG